MPCRYGARAAMAGRMRGRIGSVTRMSLDSAPSRCRRRPIAVERLASVFVHLAWKTGMTMRFIIRVVVNAFALWVVTLIPALQVQITAFAPGETLQLVLTLLAVAAIFALVNTFIGTVVKIVAFPLYILTLGSSGS